MTNAQFELAVLIIKGITQATTYISRAAARLDKVASMTDEECLTAIPVVQANINAHDETIQNL